MPCEVGLFCQLHGTFVCFLWRPYGIGRTDRRTCGGHVLFVDNRMDVRPFEGVVHVRRVFSSASDTHHFVVTRDARRTRVNLRPLLRVPSAHVLVPRAPPFFARYRACREVYGTEAASGGPKIRAASLVRIGRILLGSVLSKLAALLLC